MSRDELARDLYIGVPLSPEVLQARAVEWDEGMVTDEDRADCYARADRLLAEETNR
jgi:hypothetical protein